MLGTTATARGSRSPQPSSSVGDMSASISATLQWFSKRPLLALVVFILCLLVGSVFVPFFILDYFSTSFQPDNVAGTNQLFSMTNSRGALKNNLQEALGLEGSGRIDTEIAQLSQHGHEYAKTHRPAGPATNAEKLQQQLQKSGVENAPLNAALIQQANDAAMLQATEQLKKEAAAAAAAAPTPVAPAPPTPLAATPAVGSDNPIKRLEIVTRVPGASPPGPGAVTPMPTEAKSGNAQPSRVAAVVAAFKHAYNAYEQNCMGQDEFHPLSKRCSNWVGSGLTIIDALPTMMLMGLTDEVERAKNWVKKELRFGTRPEPVSFFETTIRVLGGLISAYDLSDGKDRFFLEKAKDLGDRLLPVFNTPSGHPRGQINLATGQAFDMSWTGGSTLLAEVGTCQMEFFALSQRLGDSKYKIAAQKPIDALDRLEVPDGLYPIYINIQNGQFANQKITFGAMGDSFYEYLLKMWLLTGRTNSQYQRMYIKSMEGMLNKLWSYTGKDQGDLWYIADLNNGMKDHKMDHLVCFAAGMLALGVSEGIVDGATANMHMDAAKKLMHTCFMTYDASPSKIGPEFVTFRPQMSPGSDASYKLRPEMVESLFILYRITGDDQYREWGWQTFEAIERHCKIPGGGYAALMDVRNPQAKEDKMESFFLAETLKYLYLLFEDNSKLVFNGKKRPGEYFVFNTECHPIRSWNN